MAKKETKKRLFHDFGEFDSADEINLAISGFKAEGDMESLKACALENGFDEAYASDYILNGGNEDFCNPLTAAVAKLELEKKENEDMGVFADDIIEYLQSELDDMRLAIGIRKKGKRLSEAAKLIYKEAQKNRVHIGGRSGNYCGPMKGFKLIRDYYTKEA